MSKYGGKPDHVPDEKTRAEVSALCAYGVRQEEISKYIGVDPKTLRKYYREELDNAKTKAHAAVGRFLYNAASGTALKDGATYADCLRAAIFWSKTQMGFKDGGDVADKGDIDRVIEVVRASRPD